MKIEIEPVKNGYIVKTDLIADESEIPIGTIVLEEKEEMRLHGDFSMPRSRIECFQELVNTLENWLGLDCYNEGDHYLETKIVKKKEDE